MFPPHQKHFPVTLKPIFDKKIYKIYIRSFSLVLAVFRCDAESECFFFVFFVSSQAVDGLSPEWLKEILCMARGALDGDGARVVDLLSESNEEVQGCFFSTNIGGVAEGRWNFRYICRGRYLGVRPCDGSPIYHQWPKRERRSGGTRPAHVRLSWWIARAGGGGVQESQTLKPGERLVASHLCGHSWCIRLSHIAYQSMSRDCLDREYHKKNDNRGKIRVGGFVGLRRACYAGYEVAS